jgi:hypothetical protein
MFSEGTIRAEIIDLVTIISHRLHVAVVGDTLIEEVAHY